MTKLYKSLVRPNLDYCIQAWRPYLEKDVEVLERVQKRATRMIEECKGLSYERRLSLVDLTTLETRRLRADLIEVYKILRGMERVDEKSFFERSVKANYHSTITTRGHNFKLYKKNFRLNVAKHNFGNRVVNEWNKLPNRIVQEGSVKLRRAGRHARVVCSIGSDAQSVAKSPAAPWSG